MFKNISCFILISLLSINFSCEDLSSEQKEIDEIPETGTVVDIDGNVYKTVKIGDQWWMAEDLRVTNFRNGDSIPHITDDGMWKDLSSGAYCNYENDTSNVKTYGRLYNWYVINDSTNIAPQGWHVPSDDDWKIMELYIGISEEDIDGLYWRGINQGGDLKEEGTTHWKSPNRGATNSTGFTAVPSGSRDHDFSYYIPSFGFLGVHVGYWTKSDSGSQALIRYLNCNGGQIHRHYTDKKIGWSIRCVKH